MKEDNSYIGYVYGTGQVVESNSWHLVVSTFLISGHSRPSYLPFLKPVSPSPSAQVVLLPTSSPRKEAQSAFRLP
ncbi:hypothetical protein SLEP1_g42855 [Rubroshorea leprosula]|uniref:Uncharacterized protein n=1 Tax=Rubroshorea leprosula TaxID=152421 RepID=A0AAV5LBL0_9ROSI|nr:hypothetical protein SLEP1_g42855 [Rubroshorea leprosula]